MENPARVFLDDERPAPEGWVHCLTVSQTKELLLSGRVVALSLDNDLGEGEEEGYRVIDFLEEQDAVFSRRLWPAEGISIHTANPSARLRMSRAIKTLPQRHSHLEIEEDHLAAKPHFFIRIAAI